MKPKKLHRSKKDRILTGVFGGLGEYFNVDANILRVGWVIVTVFTGLVPGVVIYILAFIIIPQSD